MTKEELLAAIENKQAVAGQTFTTMNLNGMNFDDMDLNHCVFDRCNVNNASFKHANLQGVVIDRSNFNETDLSGADMTGAEVKYSNFSYSSIIGTNISNVVSKNTSFMSAYKTEEEKIEGEKHKQERDDMFRGRIGRETTEAEIVEEEETDGAEGEVIE